MTASLPGGDPEPVLWSHPPGGVGRSDPTDIWVTLVEFAGHDPLGVPHIEVYAATRSLVAAATTAEISQVLVAFVTSIGARVEPGPPPHRPGTTNIDLSIEGGQAQHVVADSFSMAGLLIEGAVPTLVADARVALARLQNDQRKSHRRWPGRP